MIVAHLFFLSGNITVHQHLWNLIVIFNRASERVAPEIWKKQVCFFTSNSANVVSSVVEYSRSFFEYPLMLDNTNVRALTNESHALISNKICRQSPSCAVLHSLAVENNLDRGLSRDIREITLIINKWNNAISVRRFTELWWQQINGNCSH